MRGRAFIFDCACLLYYNCYKINPNRSESSKDSLYWTKNNKATTNPINDDDKCFQYAATVALNHEEIGRKFAKNIKNQGFYK